MRLPDQIQRLVDANPNITLCVRRSLFDNYGRILAENDTNIFENVAFARVAFTVHAWQQVHKHTVATLQLAGISLYANFSAPKLHVSAKLHDNGFKVALYAETSKGTFTDVTLNDYWTPDDTLFLSNNHLACQLLIPQVKALANMLSTLSTNVPEAPQDALHFATELKDYQLTKHGNRNNML